MSGQSASTRPTTRPLVRLPSNAVAYVAILAALVSAGVHLLLAPRVMGFSRTVGILFYLQGLGFVAGVLVFLSRYWRRELYLVAVAYALATIIAFFALGGRLNQLAIVSKVAEGLFAVAAAYLYVAEE
jgi:hypothetical protein